MRRILIGSVVVVILLGLLLVVLIRQPAVQDRLVERVFTSRMMAGPPDVFGDDALRVVLCGTASPLASPTRAGPCTAVFAGGAFYVVDVGMRSWNNMAQWGIPGERLGGVFLTHFHSDHIGQLGEYYLQSWVGGREGRRAVYGPPGVETVVAGFEQAYSNDALVRTAHHGEEILSPESERMRAVTVPVGQTPTGSVVVFEADGLRVSAFGVDHSPVRPAVGYRFDYGGRSVVVSGDTVKSANLIEAARGADVLVHEAQANHIIAIGQAAAEKAGMKRRAKILSDIPSYHTTPVQAAEIANEAGVGLLVLTHLTPPPPSGVIEFIFMRGVDDVREDVVVGDDGMLIELPRGSDEITIGSLR